MLLTIYLVVLYVMKMQCKSISVAPKDTSPILSLSRRNIPTEYPTPWEAPARPRIVPENPTLEVLHGGPITAPEYSTPSTVPSKLEQSTFEVLPGKPYNAPIYPAPSIVLDRPENSALAVLSVSSPPTDYQKPNVIPGNTPSGVLRGPLPYERPSGVPQNPSPVDPPGAVPPIAYEDQEGRVYLIPGYQRFHRELLDSGKLLDNEEFHFEKEGDTDFYLQKRSADEFYSNLDDISRIAGGRSNFGKIRTRRSPRGEDVTKKYEPLNQRKI